MSERFGNAEAIGTSLAVFGAVAMIMTGFQRQASSSEDLGGSFFDLEHEELERFVQSVPKIELHVHLDGAFDPHFLWNHLKKHPEKLYCFPTEQKLPWAKPGEPPLPLRQLVGNCQSPLAYRRLCTCRRRYRQFRHLDKYKPSERQKPTLEDMLTCFEFFFPLVYDDLDLLEDLAFDFVRRQYEQNVIYTEVRYSPHLLSKDPRKALDSITEGLRRGCVKFRVTVNQILCAINHNPSWSNDIVELAAERRQHFPCAVVGIDIAAGETHFARDSGLWKGHYNMCQRAKELKLNITIHAGETPDSAQNVQIAIEEYGAKRIGHAYRIFDRPDIIDFVLEKQVHLEICPTSSVETGGWEKTQWKDHPANIFYERGISISLSSDDPAVFNTSLTWQYRIALKKMGWDMDDVMTMLESAIQASFLDGAHREELRRKIRAWKVGDNPAFEDRVHYD